MKLSYLLLIKAVCCFMMTVFVNPAMSQEITEDDIYNAVNDIIADLDDGNLIDQIPISPYLEDEPLILDFYPFVYDIDILFKSGSLDKYFNQEDKRFFDKQILKNKNFVYRQCKIKNKIVIKSEDLRNFNDFDKPSRKDYWEKYMVKYGEQGYYTISVPLFSSDKKTLLVIVEDGFLVSTIRGMIFVNENDKWIIKDTIWRGS